MKGSFLFSTAYLPSISFFSQLINSEKIIIEKHEHYIKQTHRSRTLIDGPNGMQTLIIPVEHKDLYRKPISEVKISYDSPWQKIHWRTITSTYRNSPFFEFYEEELKGHYETKTETLFDFNRELLSKIFSLIKHPLQPAFTETYNPVVGEEISDLRNSTSKISIPEYHQVFSERNGFLNDLSIVDLLFNKGMETKAFLLSPENT